MGVIDVSDPLASSLNSMDDVDAKMPGFKEATREWFRIYKMPDGKPENVFGFEGAFQDAAFATKIIEETHVFWKELVGLQEPNEDPGKLCISCVNVDGAKEALPREEADAIPPRALSSVKQARSVTALMTPGITPTCSKSIMPTCSESITPTCSERSRSNSCSDVLPVLSQTAFLQSPQYCEPAATAMELGSVLLSQ